MSNNDKFKATVQDIKNTLIFLKDKSPTPDDEIQARELLIDYFKELRSINTIPSQESLIEKVLNLLKNWDTLELWFKEVKGLSAVIEEVVNIGEGKVAPKPEPSKEDKQASATSPQIDIKELVNQVSKEFKGEIGALQDRISQLQKELDKKNIDLKTAQDANALPAEAKPTPMEVKSAPQQAKPAKKEEKHSSLQKLGPIKITIPSLKVPQKPPLEKAKPKIEPPKLAMEEPASFESLENIDLELEKEKNIPLNLKKTETSPIQKPKITPVEIEQPKPKIEEELDSDMTFELPEIIPPEEEKPTIKLATGAKPKIAPVVEEEVQFSEVPETPKIIRASINKPSIKPSSAEKPKITPVVEEEIETPDGWEKPKITPVVEEVSEESVTPEKSKITPVIVEEETSPPPTIRPKSTPFLVNIPKISAASKETPKISPVSAQKPSITPFTVEKPKISPVKEGKAESISAKSSGSDLFNAFSPSSKTAEKPLEKVSEPAVGAFEDEDKKKKGEKKRKRGDKPGQSFGSPSAELESSEFGTGASEGMPADKDSLYQELIALEGKRYSIEKIFKELEKNYEKGQVDDFEYKKQGDEFKAKLGEITDRINSIRRVISTL